MHLAVRPFVTTGIALVGASVIAVAPVAPPLPDVKVPAVASTAAVQLSASWQELIENTNTSIQALVNFYAEAPFPIVEQILKNQTANFDAIVEALGNTGNGLITALTETLPATLQTATEALANGDVVGFVNGLVLATFAPFVPLLTGGLPAALQQAFIGTIQNLVNVVAAVTDPGNLLLYVIGPAGPFINVIGASAVAAQNIIDSLNGGDVLTALIDAPATVLDGFLNGGYGPNLIDLIFPGAPVTLTAGGLLTLLNVDTPPLSLPGPIASLVEIQRLIAQTLGWTPPTAAATADAAATAAAVGDSDGAGLATAKVTDTSVSDAQILNVNLDPAPSPAGALDATEQETVSGEEGTDGAVGAEEGAVDGDVSGAEDDDEGAVEDADEVGSTANDGTDTSQSSFTDKVRDGLEQHLESGSPSTESGNVSDAGSESASTDNDSNNADE